VSDLVRLLLVSAVVMDLSHTVAPRGEIQDQERPRLQ